MTDSNRPSIGNLILVPAIITLAVTILRLVGELQHWSSVFFNSSAGGGGAIVGISWLPIIFGPYFALKLAGVGDRPAGAGKAIGMGVAGFVVLVLGAVLAGWAATRPSPILILALGGFLIMLAAGFVALSGWPSLGKVLFAYAFAARIPVLIVMFIAMSANGGQGWGTHYDVVDPHYASLGFTQKFLLFAFAPQMTLWIGFTVVACMLLGSIAVAITGRGKTAAPAAA